MSVVPSGSWIRELHDPFNYFLLLCVVFGVLYHYWFQRSISMQNKAWVQNIRYILIALGIILFWRGTLNLSDRYFFPQHFLLSQVLSLVMGITLLVILGNPLSSLSH